MSAELEILRSQLAVLLSLRPFYPTGTHLPLDEHKAAMDKLDAWETEKTRLEMLIALKTPPETVSWTSSKAWSKVPSDYRMEDGE